MATDLELGLVWDSDQQDFEVSLRLTTDGVDQMCHLRKAITIDAGILNELTDDEPAYGAGLTGMVFAQPAIREYFRQAAGRGDDVHFRLHIDGPARFHRIRWESLRDPDNLKYRIATSNFLFSRYLSSGDWRPITFTERPERRALVVVAAPTDLAYHNLAEVDLDGEIRRARAALDGYWVDVLGGGGQASMVRIAELLNKTAYEVFYLVAHGRLVDNEPHLVLEDADGKYARVDGIRLAEAIRGLDGKPRLAMLLSCQSADAGDDGPSGADGLLAGLGPRLCGAGIPAVVAMQGNVTVETAQRFATRFFQFFRETPVVDHAMARARSAVEDRRDWWAPVLFSRLRSGRAYYQPRPEADADDAWNDFAVMLRHHEVTPILGAGLSDGILGSRSAIAQGWVHRWQMPIASYGQSNLAQVAQYLRVHKAQMTVRGYLLEYLMSDLRERVEVAREGEPFFDLPESMLAESTPGPLDAIHEVGRRMRVASRDDPYRVAATLNAPVFFTTGWTDLLQEAMRERGKNPRTMCFPWYRRAKWVDLDQNDVADWPPPDEENPWVCQLFGRLDNPQSLVLSEDDYFAWLSAWIDKRPTMPTNLSVLSTALTEGSLLFVGYQLREWDFQMLFQSILSFGGAERLRDRNHIGVQLMQDDVIEPEAARHYLESYLKDTNVRIFWKDTRSFFAELRERTGLAT